MILSEQDVITSLLSNVSVDSAVFDDVSPINIYNDWCKTYSIDHNIQATPEVEEDNYLSTRTDLENWDMPDSYKNLDIYNYVLDKCPDEIINMNRVCYELREYELRGMFPVLNFLVYLVDRCKEHNVVLGVGRGSSVASYVLYLIGVHKVDSLKYDLDIEEFLK